MCVVYDKIIIGAGLYGLYSAAACGGVSERVLVLEKDSAPFSRATYINQARVHQGYHYPRSLSTAIKSASYFKRFNDEFAFCVNSGFKKIYATSKEFSWSSAECFAKFCSSAEIPFEQLCADNYFNKGMCDGAFLTQEYTYDAKILRDYYIEKLKQMSNVEIMCNVDIAEIEKFSDCFEIRLNNGKIFKTKFLLNATYASTNQISAMLGFDLFKIKYELCEIILCKANDNLEDYGFTVMDGPFFSIMPFGNTGLHSLTSVTFTPHSASVQDLPTFDCQKKSGGYCSEKKLGNCNYCPARPQSAFTYMSSLARKYLRSRYKFEYVSSLFSMKPILTASEIDDSRPTVIKKYCSKPTYISVLSGKINTVYDLDEVLFDE